MEDGYPTEGPYDAILISGQIGELPDALLDQLKHGGRLVAVVDGPYGLGQVTRWLRFGETYDRQVLFEAQHSARCRNFSAKPVFVF